LQHVLRVTWQVAPLQCPLIWRHCSRCKSPMPFACSMKFRTNAQKKRIDVWLIYRCRGCGDSWNMPIHERVAIGDLAHDAFEAIARNDPALAMRYAFDRERLARHGTRLEESTHLAVRKSRQEGRDDAPVVEISLALALPCQIRLDRLLSGELDVTRSQLRLLHDRGLLRVAQPLRKSLRSPIADGQCVSIDLRDDAVQPDLAEIIRRGASE
jgi:hypothetical protein